MPQVSTALAPEYAEIIARQFKGASSDPIAAPAGLQKELTVLRRLVSQYGRSAQPELLQITQLMALALLSLNRSNRRVSRAAVERLKQILIDGRYHNGHPQGMTVNWNGHLLDGQHRLIAIAETAVEVDVWVTFGADPDVFSSMDVGNKRKAAQNLERDGVKSAALVAAVVRLKYRTENEGLSPDEDAVYRIGTKLVHANDLLHRAMIQMWRLRTDKPGITPSSATLAYWLIGSQSAGSSQLDKFWDFLVRGNNLDLDSPIYKARRELSRFERVERKANQLLAQAEQSALIIRAFNAWRGDWPMKLKWSHAHKLPRVDSKD